MMDVTLLICTHNRARVLRNTLAAISRLDVPLSLTWEVIVVANNCSDDTSAVVEAFAASSDAPVTRHFTEPRHGVAFARKRGIAASRGRLIAYIDDDCLPHADWLVEAVRFADEHPRAGAFGGRNTLVWEQEPPPLCVAYGGSLAGQNWGDQAYRLPDEGKEYPCGAGLVMRRVAVMDADYLSKGCLVGRRSAAMGAGEDTEVQLMIREAGWEIWYAPSLQLDHVIPTARMRLDYLCRLHLGFGLAETYLRLLSRRLPLTLSNRWRGVQWAYADVRAVLARFRLGFVRYENERPTWLIRLCYSLGCLAGAVKLLCLRRAS